MTLSRPVTGLPGSYSNINGIHIIHAKPGATCSKVLMEKWTQHNQWWKT